MNDLPTTYGLRKKNCIELTCKTENNIIKNWQQVNDHQIHKRNTLYIIRKIQLYTINFP